MTNEGKRLEPLTPVWRGSAGSVMLGWGSVSLEGRMTVNPYKDVLRNHLYLFGRISFITPVTFQRLGDLSGGTVEQIWLYGKAQSKVLPY